MTTNGPFLLPESFPSATSLYLYQVNRYISFASMTYSILEIVSTLPDEVELIWPARRGFMKTVFLINKYSPLIDFTLVALVDLVRREPEACRVSFQVLTYSYLLGTLVSEFILIARTYALWGCDRRLVYCALFIAGMMIPHAFYIVYDMLRESDFKSGQEVTHLIGCMPNIHDRNAWPAYTYLICSETMVVILTVLKRYVDPEIVQGSFASVVLPTMYRDGTCFWAVVLALSILNLLMMFFAPGGLSYSVQMPLRVVHSALCNRVLLNLRRAAACVPSEGSEDSSAVLTTVVFHQQPMTNLGTGGETLTNYTFVGADVWVDDPESDSSSA
ncbi:hypothetical protein GSI_10965 [Ganoderma sinense ZZ0214-1]|uniref:DUF6533 domain-containing protein n=1 Tax=Ganoderma sinense ZZ0214-1 TaxID=1077348 RepID=A0A2G8S231_9APHY|nr:hypothetical protein GSI_10965 [Ganoderma sinense ZZ0214-1]